MSEPRTGHRLIGIDIIRALAAGGVLVDHVFFRCLGDSLPRFALDLVSLLGGWGVGLFFVLSGVCIHLPMAERLKQDGQAKLDLGSYYQRRFTRIYPPHLVVLLVSALVAALLADPKQAAPFLSVPTAEQMLAHLLLIHTFVPGFRYTINSVLWSVAVETHFYLLYPLILRARRKYSMLTLVFALLGLSLLVKAVILLTRPPVLWVEVLEFNFMRRFWEWLLGAWIAERWVQSGHPTTQGFGRLWFALPVSFLISLFIKDLPGGLSWLSLLWPVAFAACIYYALQGPPKARNALERGLGWLGYISYSTYLVHPVVLVLVTVAVPAATLSPWLRLPAVGIAAVLGSAAFFYAVERWFMLRAAKSKSPWSSALENAA